MKKNNALLNIIIVLLSLNTSATLWAEEPKATPDNNTATTPTPETNSADKKDYITPAPQTSRIEALKASLSIRRLGHQIQPLEANGEPFLTLYRPSITSSTQGCIIMLHSDNEHPDWPDAIAPLRNALPAHSWCTLSIEVPDIIKRAAPVKTEAPTTENNQQPIEPPNQTEVFARIQATINKAKTENIERFVFLGYKTGASYALSFLANNQASGEALVLIDIDAPPNLSNYEMAQQIRRVSQPILDYYVNNNAGSDQFATWRKQAANQRTANRSGYIQLDALPDRATGKDSKQLLIQRVRGFLKQNTRQILQKKPLPRVKKGLFYESPINT
ncbi:DUF3530 family protein [Marinomonas sp. RSW2]|uniref:DUF3530 family protein n=1 Tax=Marinomonas maritima TaxID=2940935 RepID=A0ABT5WGJ4_9GAMM|nr:DUF3530 family protein [Marinomonas maritima]MDE8603943.1 DUF3530 family protein [Marinomonas maritima]